MSGKKILVEQKIWDAVITELEQCLYLEDGSVDVDVLSVLSAAKTELQKNNTDNYYPANWNNITAEQILNHQPKSDDNVCIAGDVAGLRLYGPIPERDYSRIENNEVEEWYLVPVKPTPEMCNAMAQWWAMQVDEEDMLDAEKAYSSMLDVAPKFTDREKSHTETTMTAEEHKEWLKEPDEERTKRLKDALGRVFGWNK